VSIPRKADSKKIQEHIKKLKEQSWLGKARAWWPDFLFRFDNIDSAAKILNTGRLLSRRAAQAAGVMGIDCAAAGVIASTADKWKQYVRLYFRPRTPTQFDSEGFRTRERYVLGAHCPVPVVMLFDASEILTRANTEFSNGNLAANAATANDAAFLQSIPFNMVYHDSWFEPSEKATIIFHRNAEVIVPDELDLSPLRFVGCRTQAEYETLLHLLGPEARKKWSVKIGLGVKASLHYRRWTFVEQVELTRGKIRFQFNPSSETPGPFRAYVEIREDETGDEYCWSQDLFLASSTLELEIRVLKHPEAYTVRLELDGQLAYSNHFEVEDIPF
jgi:hypothetical protein